MKKGNKEITAFVKLALNVTHYYVFFQFNRIMRNNTLGRF